MEDFGAFEHQSVESSCRPHQNLAFVRGALPLMHSTHVASESLAVFEYQVAFLANVQLLGFV